MTLPSSLSYGRLFLEGTPVAAVLFLWGLLAEVSPGVVSTGFLLAGIAMALLYVAVRGVSLAASVSATLPPTDPAGALRESAAVAIPAGAWLLASLVLHQVLRALLYEVGFTPVRALADAVGVALAGAGVATVLLYAVAVGVPRVRAAGATGSPGR